MWFPPCGSAEQGYIGLGTGRSNRPSCLLEVAGGREPWGCQEAETLEVQPVSESVSLLCEGLHLLSPELIPLARGPARGAARTVPGRPQHPLPPLGGGMRQEWKHPSMGIVGLWQPLASRTTSPSWKSLAQQDVGQEALSGLATKQ